MASRSPIWWDRGKGIIKARSFDVRLGSPPSVAGGLFFFWAGVDWPARPPEGMTQPHAAGVGHTPVKKARGADTTLSKYVFGVIFDSVLPKERTKFVLETGLAVMCFLVLDVPADLIQIG
jgi:hypothetical protein